MTLARRHRLLTVILSLWALLFAQLALAGYACPRIEQASEVVQMSEAGTPCAETMKQAIEEQQPALCHAHCQAAPHSDYTYQLSALTTLAQLGVVLTIPAALPRGPQWPLAPMRPNAGPPLAIAHCCFRI